MFRTKDEKQNMLHRLKIIRGHLEKVSEMIENDVYCIDILTQTKAIHSSLSKVDEMLLQKHLSHCVVDHIREGHGDKAIDEIMNVFREQKGT